MPVDSGAKKILVALPFNMLKEVDTIAIVEHRTRSELVRESLRLYLEKFKLKQRQFGVDSFTES